MALTDINFQSGEGEDFIVERTPGTQYVPSDIESESGGSQYLVMETPQVTGGGGGGSIYVMMD